uniref:InfA n=1 Tax=Thulinella chrysantha TaxID=1522775 RepID=A0A7M3ULJ5_9ROSI|nr:InfA [Thulinella chrysantha]QOI12765.1 InfA [Thulinella chrysantha]
MYELTRGHKIYRLHNKDSNY